MQVSQVNDHVTHAVIGGAAAIDFGISSSAEFFNILSSTLYKDQILAVVREVLCNAWDAHIESGCTDKPVEITLTDDRFVIKDFGKGIHRDDMGLIYGTYGNSTKKNDGTQTGGFGLGCKAPFAYTDHFEVISCHDGVKTIYNLSKSSAQAMGKPGIVPIASFPANGETGLQVSIHIHNKPDRERFLKLIKRIARNGDMNMKLNHTAIDRLGFDSMVSEYLVTMDQEIMDNPTRIMVRYGNVVYPVDVVNELFEEYSRINSHLNSLKWNQDIPYYLLFQAPPHSIAVTPSRESLSMQEHTIKTLSALMNKFIAMLDGEFVQACDQITVDTIHASVNAAQVSELLSRKHQLPGVAKKVRSNPENIFDLASMARCYMAANYPDTLEFRKKDITTRLTAMADAGLLQRGIVQTYLRAMEKVRKSDGRHNWWREKGRSNDWLQRRVIGPLVSKMLAAGVDHKRLYGYDGDDMNTSEYGNFNVPMVPATSISPYHHFASLPYLRNIVVLTANRVGLTERAYKHKVFKELGNYHGFLVYHVSMKKQEREKAIEFFNSSGMEVVDLTVRQEWEIDLPKVVSKPRKPVKQGVVSLTSVLTKASIDTFQSRLDNAARIMNPEFVMQVAVRKDTPADVLYPWNSECSRYIVDLFGAKGGITNNSAVHEKWIKNGARNAEDYLHEKICEAMTLNPNIQEYWAFDVDRAMEESNINHASKELVQLVYRSAVLRKEFGLVNNLSEVEKKIVCLWKYAVNRHKWNTPALLKATADHLKTIRMDPANKAFLTKFSNNPMLDIINKTGLSTLIRAGDANSPQTKKAIEVLITVINN